MKNKIIKSLAFIIIAVILLTSTFPVTAQSTTRTVSDAQSIVDGIVSYKLNKSSAENIQQWINGSLTSNAGTSSEWYIVALSQYGKYDFSSYKKALLKYLSSNEVYSASSRQKYALALISVGSGDKYIYNTLNDSIGKQGVMSWIYGLHLLNNGYKSNGYSVATVKDKLLSLQLSDGGWAVSGTSSDVDVTAMAVQALAPHYKEAKVKSAVDKAITLLSDRQKPDGDYASYGVNCSESTAQVLVALSSLGIDCKRDSRFIKNGNTLFDAIKKYQLSNGGFCHKVDGGVSETATVQVFYSMVSYLRMINGKTSLYVLDGRNPSILEIPEIPPKSEETTSAVNTPSEIATQKPSTDKTEGESAKNEYETTEQSGAVASTEELTASAETGETSQSSSYDTAENHQTESDKKRDSYKLWVCLAIFAVAGSACIVLYVKKNRNIKNFLIIFGVAAGLSAVVFAVNITSADDYYNSTADKNGVGTVTISIRCDTIANENDNQYIASNGIILGETTCEIEQGDTVYDVLAEVTAKSKIHLETSGTNDSVYVEGINNIYEFDYGELSGWMYYVNGETASVSCGEYVLSDGDTVQWAYTRNMGKDITVK